MKFFTTVAGLLLAFVFTSHAQMGELKFGVDAKTATLGDDDYHIGAGAAANVLYGIMDFVDLGIRANYLNYQPQGNVDDELDDINQAGVNLAGLLTPYRPEMAQNRFAQMFRPKVGGHVGYERFDDGNFLDLGLDAQAVFTVTENLDLYGTVIPTWLIDEDGNDYLTKFDVGIQFRLPALGGLAG